MSSVGPICRISPSVRPCQPHCGQSRTPSCPNKPLGLANLVITAKIRINASAGEAAANMTSDMHNAWMDWWMRPVKYLQSSTAAYISTELENRNSIFDLWSIVRGCNLKGNVLFVKAGLWFSCEDMTQVQLSLIVGNRIMDHSWWVPIVHGVVAFLLPFSVSFHQGVKVLLVSFALLAPSGRYDMVDLVRWCDFLHRIR